MKFTPTPLAGAFTVELEPFTDDRGAFARAFCAREFAEAGIPMRIAQANLSLNPRRGTLRGMHYQLPPAAEAKFLRCVKGAIFDVIVDLREDSDTYLEWFGVELSADNGTALYVPELFGHGFLTLTDDVLVHYDVSEFYTPGAERGLRYDDPRIGIRWPAEVAVISDKDASWPLLDTGGVGR